MRVVWPTFTRDWDIEMREVPMTHGRYERILVRLGVRQDLAS